MAFNFISYYLPPESLTYLSYMVFSPFSSLWQGLLLLPKVRKKFLIWFSKLFQPRETCLPFSSQCLCCFFHLFVLVFRPTLDYASGITPGRAQCCTGCQGSNSGELCVCETSSFTHRPSSSAPPVAFSCFCVRSSCSAPSYLPGALVE